jgi:diguanylate cyclase (GGDEF)-like protein
MDPSLSERGAILEAVRAHLARGDARTALQALAPVGDNLGDAASDLGLRSARARCHVLMGDPLAALNDFLAAERAAVAARDVPARCECLLGIASLEIEAGDYGPAANRLQSVLAMAPQGSDTVVADAHHQLGMLSARLEDFGMARRFYESAMQIRRSLGQIDGLARGTNSLGVLHLREGGALELTDPDASRRHFETALERFRDAAQLAALADDPHLAALVEGNIGSARGSLADLSGAIQHFQQQLVQLRALGDKVNEALALTNLAEARRKQGAPGAALDHLAKAREIAERTRSRARLLRVEQESAECHEALGDAAAALSHLKAARRLERALHHGQAEASARALALQIEMRRALAEAEAMRRERDALAQAQEELQALALTDALTGLANRAMLDRRLPQLVAEATQRAGQLAIALLDIDHFKAVNDHHSHAVGDAVLRRAADLVRRGVRPTDFTARYGGEEIVIALASAGAASAGQILERLRAAFFEHDWAAVHPGVAVTVSIGYTLVAAGDTAAAALSRADAALYRAKAGGRNRVVALQP